MTNKDILSQFPDGDLKNIMQELIVANDSLANKEPVYGFHHKFYVPGWIGFIQECIVESKMQKFDKQVFYAGKGYIDFINWIGDKADAVAKCYSEIENMDEAKSTVCKKLIVAIFDSTIDNWAKCCPEIATYCNFDFNENTKISPIGWIHYKLASILQKFEYPQFDSSSSKGSAVSVMKAQGYYIIGYILNVIILACVLGIIGAIFK